MANRRAEATQVPTTVFALIMMNALFSAGAPAAQAAEQRGTAAGAGTLAWTPGLTPLDPYKETVKRNLTTEERNNALHDCWPGYLCVAAGQGDGRHTVYELWYCTRRTLSNFLGAGAVTNNQNGTAPAYLLNRNKIVVSTIPSDNKTRRISSWDPVWYIDVC